MNIFRYVTFLTLFIFISNCSGDEAQEQFERSALSSARLITEINSCEESPTSTDDNDWRVSPLYVGLVDVFPICPNPLSIGSQASLEVTLSGAPLTIIDLYYLNFNDNLTYLETLEVTSDFDQIAFIITPAQFGSNEVARNFHRLILFDSNRRVISYGDLRIE